MPAPKKPRKPSSPDERALKEARTLAYRARWWASVFGVVLVAAVVAWSAAYRARNSGKIDMKSGSQLMGITVPFLLTGFFGSLHWLNIFLKQKKRLAALERGENADDSATAATRGRVYVHPQCGGHTVVTGGDFFSLSDPFEFTLSSYCSKCQRQISLADLKWADTRVSIKKYRQRQRQKASPLTWIWRVLVPPLLGALVLVVAAFIQQRGRPMDRPVLFGALGAGVFGGLVVSRICTALGMRYEQPEGSPEHAPDAED